MCAWATRLACETTKMIKEPLLSIRATMGLAVEGRGFILSMLPSEILNLGGAVRWERDRKPQAETVEKRGERRWGLGRETPTDSGGE